MALAQPLLGALDFAVAGAVVWVLLPPSAHIGYFAFAGLYAAAITVGLLSHVPGGLGVFEAMLLLMLPEVPTEELLGSLLAFRAVYYLAPLVVGGLAFLIEELRAQSSRWARAQAVASAYIAPVVPQVAATLTFVAGAVLLLSGATPGVDARIEVLHRMLPLAILEVSHLVGSLVGLGLIVLASSLRRRVNAAYHIALALIAAGIAASLLKGIDFEEAVLLAIAGAVLVLGRSSFYRPSSILAERFTPAWVVSIVGVIAATVWVGFFAYRNVDYSSDLWWTFAFNADAPRMLRAALIVGVTAAALLLAELAAPRASRARDGERGRSRRRRAARSSAPDQSLANAALMGDKRLLFSDDANAFVMYQVAGRSWIALGDPVGPQLRTAKSSSGASASFPIGTAGWTVFYQASRDAAAAVHRPRARGVQARRRSARAARRSSRSRAAHARSCAKTIVARFATARRSRSCRAERVRAIAARAAKISDAWLADKATAREAFLRRRVRPAYLGSSTSRSCVEWACSSRSRIFGRRGRSASCRSISCASVPTRRAARWTSCSSS